MISSALFPALLSLVSLPWQCSAAAAASSTVDTSSTFKPPQVFKNSNLNHIISLEKNYAKETINVVIKNIDKQPQDEYYLPFTSEQMSRVGAVEVKDKKDASIGSFVVEAVEFDPNR